MNNLYTMKQNWICKVVSLWNAADNVAITTQKALIFFPLCQKLSPQPLVWHPSLLRNTDILFTQGLHFLEVHS